MIIYGMFMSYGLFIHCGQCSPFAADCYGHYGAFQPFADLLLIYFLCYLMQRQRIIYTIFVRYFTPTTSKSLFGLGISLQ